MNGSVHDGGAITLTMALKVLPQRRRLCTLDLRSTLCIHPLENQLFGTFCEVEIEMLKHGV